MRPGESEHMPQLVVLGRLLGSQCKWRGHDLHTGNTIRDQRFPVRNIETMQVVQRIENRVDRFRLGEKADHAAVEVQVGQQHAAILTSKLTRHMDGNRRGAAAALRGHESKALACTLDATLATTTSLRALL